MLLLHSNQVLCLHGDSTVNQLVDIYNTFCKALDEGKEVRAIFCDIKKSIRQSLAQGTSF